MRALAFVLAVAIAAGSSGCRTMAGYESIPVESEPPGAEVIVHCGEFHQTAVTPGTVLLARNAPNCRVGIHKEGYFDEVVWLRRVPGQAGWIDALVVSAITAGVLITSSAGGTTEAEVAGEVLVFGIIPWIASLANCNYCEHLPESIDVVLRPLPEPEPYE
ncbi:MAG: hypothetical protein ACSLFQ_23785 [Thermoanaerobaculia bacterium]